MPWRNQVERAFVATLGSSAFHPDGEVPKDPPTHQHNKVLVEWKWGQMATKNDWNYLTYTNLMFKLAIKNGAKHKCIPPRQNPRFLALEFCRGPWQWRSMANGSFGKPKKVCDDSEVAKFWRGFKFSIYFRRQKYLRWECTQQEKHLEVGVTSFSRGICCPTAEYEIYIYMNICCL